MHEMHSYLLRCVTDRPPLTATAKSL
eukprot:SAG11_NODE_25558_length_357_cov_0.798450_1_plen_25_part_01